MEHALLRRLLPASFKKGKSTYTAEIERQKAAIDNRITASTSYFSSKRHLLCAKEPSKNTDLGDGCFLKELSQVVPKSVLISGSLIELTYTMPAKFGARGHTEFPEEADLWDPRFVNTLPFDCNMVPRRHSEAALERTKQNWGWFSSAAADYPTLGTFGKLPFEIRRLVFEAALQCRPTMSQDGVWEYDAQGVHPLNLSSYIYGFGRRGGVDRSIGYLRQVSSIMKAEYEGVFLSTTNFRFNSPQTLQSFFSHLADAEKGLIRSVTLGVCPWIRVDEWLQSISNLPRGLRHVEIKTYDIAAWMPGPGQYPIEFRNLVQRTIEGVPDAQVSLSRCGVIP